MGWDKDGIVLGIALPAPDNAVAISGSSSITKALRPVLCAAITVEPEPPNQSSTTSLRFHTSLIASAIIATGSPSGASPNPPAGQPRSCLHLGTAAGPSRLSPFFISTSVSSTRPFACHPGVATDRGVGNVLTPLFQIAKARAKRRRDRGQIRGLSRAPEGVARLSRQANFFNYPQISLLLRAKALLIFLAQGIAD